MNAAATANPAHPAAPTAPGTTGGAAATDWAGIDGNQPPPVDSPERNGRWKLDRAYGWNRAATPGADPEAAAGDAPGDAAIGDAAAAAENYRRDGRPIEWRNANGGIVRSTSGTKEDVESPPSRRARRWAVPIAVIVVLLAGATYVVVRQFAPSAPAARHASTTPGPTHPPGSVAPSGVPALAKVNWLCDEQRPDDSVALPNNQKPYNGRAAYAGFTWFMFSNDFPISLPGSFQIAYSGTTACLYDSTSPSRMIGIHKWTPSGPAATEARAAMQSYQAQASKLESFHQVRPVSAVDGPTASSATWEYTWVGATGPLHTFARVYLVAKTAYLISWTTSAGAADSDTSVYANMQGSIVIGQMP